MTQETPIQQDNAVSIQIGDICCAISCNDADVHSSLQSLFKDFLSDQPADFSIELVSAEGKLNPAGLEQVISEAVFTHHGGSFATSNGMMTGTYDLGRRTMSITGDRSLIDPNLKFNLLNRLLCLGYYSACKVKHDGNPTGFLVHGCGIVHDGKALVFAGPSGIGKSTIARLCGERYGPTLNDEIVLISRPEPDADSLLVRGTPVVGAYSHRSPAGAPLRCIFMLKQGSETIIRSISKTDAYLRFMRQVIAPAYIGQKDRREIYSLIADFSAEVTRTSEVFELEFSLDPGELWRSIEQVEQTLG